VLRSRVKADVSVEWPRTLETDEERARRSAALLFDDSRADESRPC
jgi:hypothetical protein